MDYDGIQVNWSAGELRRLEKVRAKRDRRDRVRTKFLHLLEECREEGIDFRTVFQYLKMKKDVLYELWEEREAWKSPSSMRDSLLLSQMEEEITAALSAESSGTLSSSSD